MSNENQKGVKMTPSVLLVLRGNEIIDELESRDPPVDIRIVISAIITKPTETKRRKTAKHSFEFMILDATEASS